MSFSASRITPTTSSTRRIATTVNGETLVTVYNGDNVWADYDANGHVQARYLFGPGTDELVARWRPADGVVWYLTDHLGTVRDLAIATGLLINTIQYDSFGRILAQSNPLAGDRFTFTGREFDAETGLYYYRAQYYDPLVGRFISQDPIGLAAGQANLYAYVGNAPLMYTDATGMLAISEYQATQAARQGVSTFIGHWIECMFISILAHSAISIVADAFGGSYAPTPHALALDALICVAVSVGPALTAASDAAALAAHSGSAGSAGAQSSTNLLDELEMFLRDEAGTVPLSAAEREALLADRAALLRGEEPQSQRMQPNAYRNSKGDLPTK